MKTLYEAYISEKVQSSKLPAEILKATKKLWSTIDMMIPFSERDYALFQDGKLRFAAYTNSKKGSILSFEALPSGEDFKVMLYASNGKIIDSVFTESTFPQDINKIRATFLHVVGNILLNI